MLGTLFILTIVSFLAWYARYHWQRRRLYQLATRIDGPPALPFIGNTLYFVKSNVGILDNIMQLAWDYKPPFKVWLGPELAIAIWKPNQVQTILNNPYALEKTKLYNLFKILAGNGLFTADVPTWRRHKKVIMPTFNQNILNSFVEVFTEKAAILVEQLRNMDSKGEFDIYNYVSKCTLDTFCETSIGVTINAQTSGCDYMKWLSRTLQIEARIMWLYWCINDYILKCIPMGREMFELREKVLSFTAAIVKEKRLRYQAKPAETKGEPQPFYEEDVSRRTTFLDKLIELSKEMGANFTDVELREEVDTFMIAGSDTTAVIGSFTLLMLSMFHEVQDKVYREILEVVGPDKPVEWTDLQKFMYLERVLKETMRLFPVAPVIGRSISKDIELDNYILPAGSTVAVLLLRLHRDPEIWPNPLEFDPDRFLPEEINKRHAYSWLPFSGGIRSCVGPKYAMMAMKVLIATVIRKYKLSTSYKNVEDVKLQFELMLKPVDGYNISLELRNTE